MTSKELIEYFNLSTNIDYDDLGDRVIKFLMGDDVNKVSTITQLVETVTELDWELFQYSLYLSNKNYSELYQMIISAYALNTGLGNVPTELTSLDIKLRSINETDKVNKLINSVFIPIVLDLLYKFKVDKKLIKLINVLLTARKLCIRYHKKVKLTLDADKFRRIKSKYPVEVSYFGFTKVFTEDELKGVWRKKAMELHPDRNHAPNASEEFLKAKGYYDTLLKIFE